MDDMAPAEQMCSVIKNDIFCFAILRNEAKKIICSDIMGRFQIESHPGMNYMFIWYAYKLNMILLRTMKNKEDAEMVTAFKICYSELNAASSYAACDRQHVNLTKYGYKVAKYHTIATFCIIDIPCFILSVWP